MTNKYRDGQTSRSAPQPHCHVGLHICPWQQSTCHAGCWRRFANRGLGYQQKAILKHKYEEAKARGEAPPDEPGMKELLAEMKATN